jgi:GntR family transcriptional regulator of arabinose operon
LDLTSDLPLYEAIKRDIKSRIESGELPEGTRILPEIELAKQRGVSRSTARKALQALEMEGLLSRTAGRGSFVRAPKHRAPSSILPGQGSLAITVSDVERYNHAGLCAQGFINTVVMGGCHAIIQPPAASGTHEFDHLLSVRQSGIAGWALWLASASEKNLQLLDSYREAGGALTLIDRYVPQLDCDFVVSKNEEMAYMLTRELIRRGHTEIGMITFRPDCTTHEDRITGYHRAFEEAGLTVENDLIVVDEVQGLEPYRMQILGLLGRRKRPTAVFCTSEDHAMWLLKELQRLEYAVPDDLELAVIDNSRFEEKVNFPVLVARQHSYEMGRIAAEMLMRRLKDPKLPAQQRFLDFDLNFSPAS